MFCLDIREGVCNIGCASWPLLAYIDWNDSKFETAVVKRRTSKKYIKNWKCVKRKIEKDGGSRNDEVRFFFSRTPGARANQEAGTTHTPEHSPVGFLFKPTIQEEKKKVTALERSYFFTTVDFVKLFKMAIYRRCKANQLIEHSGKRSVPCARVVFDK